MGVHSDSLPLTVVDDYADTILAQQISQISGVSQVSIGGEQKPAVRVQIDPAKLAAKGLTLDQFGLSAGDELVVGRQRQVFNPAASAVLGTIASLSAIFFAVHH
jgi:hypothetical protein